MSGQKAIPSKFYSTVIVAMALILSSPGLARAGLKHSASHPPKPSTKVTVETYPAVDPDPQAEAAEDLTSQVQGASEGAPLPVKKIRRAKGGAKVAKTKAAPKPAPEPLTGEENLDAPDSSENSDTIATAAAAPIPVKSPAEVRGYDFVPETQARAISKRLRLVEALLVRYQRAYDYRAYTVAQLQSIYAKLESERAVFAPPATGPTSH